MFTPQSWGSIFGLRPWHDISYFYSLMTIFLSALVAFTVASEFYRGGRVISKHTGQGMFASMVQLTHRNTRRYGGYVVHLGVVAGDDRILRRGPQPGKRDGDGLTATR